jgi:hypothetical protein
MEHEIIGHTKKAYKVMKNPKMPFSEKAKEILIEVLIIVFAVSFAAFIERTREHYKEKAEAKEFIIGLKGDIKDEISLLQGSAKSMDTLRKNYGMIFKLKNSEVDSIQKKHITGIFNIAVFNSKVVNGRYEGFKSSGKIQTIENDSLRNDILEYYQQDIPLIDFAESALNQNQNRLEEMLINGSNEMGNDPTGVIRMLTSAKGKLILEFSIGYSNQVSGKYNEVIKQAKKIEKEIDEEYE